jgi:hypothetical protein
MIIPYTPRDDTASKYKAPKLIFTNTSPSPTGITAQAIIAITKVILGAKKNKNL